MKLTLADGREISLDSLEQHRTYAGVLCGRFSARDHDERIARFVEEARKRLPGLATVHVIPPVRTPLPYKANSSAPVAERLPPVVSVAVFESSTVANDEGEMFSSAAFLWFQPGFGLPDELARKSMQDVDWRAVATDWSY